jgi:hypothetical protein
VAILPLRLSHHFEDMPISFMQAASHGWILGTGQELYLEAAQDCAIATQDGLGAIQVKDTAANITGSSHWS